MITSVLKHYLVMITVYLLLVIYLLEIQSYHHHVIKLSNYGMLHLGKVSAISANRSIYVLISLSLFLDIVSRHLMDIWTGLDLLYQVRMANI